MLLLHWQVLRIQRRLSTAGSNTAQLLGTIIELRPPRQPPLHPDVNLTPYIDSLRRIIAQFQMARLPLAS